MNTDVLVAVVTFKTINFPGDHGGEANGGRSYSERIELLNVKCSYYRLMKSYFNALIRCKAVLVKKTIGIDFLNTLVFTYSPPLESTSSRIKLLSKLLSIHTGNVTLCTNKFLGILHSLFGVNKVI